MRESVSFITKMSLRKNHVLALDDCFAAPITTNSKKKRKKKGTHNLNSIQFLFIFLFALLTELLNDIVTKQFIIRNMNWSFQVHLVYAFSFYFI